MILLTDPRRRSSEIARGWLPLSLNCSDFVQLARVRPAVSLIPTFQNFVVGADAPPLGFGASWYGPRRSQDSGEPAHVGWRVFPWRFRSSVLIHALDPHLACPTPVRSSDHRQSATRCSDRPGARSLNFNGSHGGVLRMLRSSRFRFGLLACAALSIAPPAMAAGLCA